MSDRGRSPERSGGGGPSRSSRQGSTSPTQSGGSPAPRGPSPARSSGSGSQGSPSGWKKGMGFDPAKPADDKSKGNTRMELPADAYSSNRDMFSLRGNKFNTEGKPEQMQVNQYRMKKIDLSKKIHQYDVSAQPSFASAI